jgi:biotin carboxyl carrier protein
MRSPGGSFILEAMKMGNRICAGTSGEITFLGVVEGDSVAAGAELIRIED